MIRSCRKTIEAINHAKAAGAVMIVAINKCDRPAADPNKVRAELLQHEVVVEQMSGDVQDVEVSAITGQGLDELLEAIALQSEILELKANPNRAAQGAVIEAQLDVGRGPVATVLIQNGTLKRGDIFVVGEQYGRVRALINDQGERIDEAGPSVPCRGSWPQRHTRSRRCSQRGRNRSTSARNRPNIAKKPPKTNVLLPVLQQLSNS